MRCIMLVDNYSLQARVKSPKNSLIWPCWPNLLYVICATGWLCVHVKTGKNDFKEIKKNKNKIKQHTLIYGSNFNVTNNLFITMTMMSKKQTNKHYYKHIHLVYRLFIQLYLGIHCNNLTSFCVIMNKAFIIIMIYNI